MNTTGKFQVELPQAEVVDLDRNYFPNPWKAEQWADLDPEQIKFFTWRDNKEVVAFALFGTAPCDDTAHLFKIMIIPSRRGDGTIAAFWSEIVIELRKLGFKSVYLEVEESNVRAIGFYQKNGFSLLRRNKAYYSNGEAALIMSLTL